MEDCVITLIDCADTLKELRRKVLRCTYTPYLLDERDIYEAFF